MSDQKKRKHNFSIRLPTNSQQIKGSSSSSSVLSHGDDASEGSETTRTRKSHSSKSARRTRDNSDNIKKIVQEEGRIARNLVTWNVPLENAERSNKIGATKQSGPCSPVKKTSSSLVQSPVQHISKVCLQKSKDNDPGKQVSAQKCSNVGSSVRKNPPRVTGKKDIRARYWAYLFENLHRAVDEIYQTCETDESVVECKEVIMMLDQYGKDFHSLIECLLMMKDYEKADEGSRRKNLAWEVRKRSPSKSLMMTYRREVFSPGPRKAARSLKFTSSTDSAVDLSLNGSIEPISHYSVYKKIDAVDDFSGGPTEGEISSDIKYSSNRTAEVDRLHDNPDTIAGSSDARACHSASTNMLSSVSSTWADRVKSACSGASLPNQKNLVSKNSQAESSVANQANVGNKSSVDAASAAESRNRFSKNNSLRPSTSSTHNLSGSLIQLSSGDQDGWETVQRGGKQRQKLATCSTLDVVNDRTNHHHQVNFTSKSLHIIPTLATSHDAQHDNQLSSSSPFLFADPQNEQLQMSLHQHSFESEPLSIDTSVFSYNNNPTNNSSFDKLQQENSHILTTTDFFSNAAEPNSKLIFGNRHHAVDKVASSISAEMPDDPFHKDAGERAAGGSPEFDDEELDTALINVLKEEHNLETLLEKESEAALESAMEEEKNYLKEIEREERQHVEDEIDIEEICDDEIDPSLQQTWDWDYLVKKYDEGKAGEKEERWGDIMEEGEARTPGRLVHVFEKLSSPSRKKPTIESRKQLDEKQAKAAELREKTLQERGENLRMLRKKVEDIQSLKLELMNQARLRMESKLQRAEEKRQILLQMKVRKAHEEDTKANEIAFINTLEAQNKRIEIMSKHQESEARLQDMQEERQRKHEEKAAKEAAAEERRKALEAERISRLQEMQDRRKQRETDFEQRQQEKEKERVEAARARDREREERLAALNKQQQAHIEELQKKIQQKQDETDRRHKEKLEAIQEKAFRMSLQHHSSEDHNDAPPKLVPYEKKKFCSVCNVLIPSEVYLLSHLRGKMHQQAICDSSQGSQLSQQDIEKFNLQHISDAPSDQVDPHAACEVERHKAFKKRCKKLKLRMTQRGSEYEASLANKVINLPSQQKNKLQKIIKDLQKCIGMQSSGPWSQNRVSTLDRCLGEISRILDKNSPAEKVVFKHLDGLSVLFQLLDTVGHPSADLPPLVPNKSLLLSCSVVKSLCLGCTEVCQYLLLSNKICILIDLISKHLNVLIPDDVSSMQQNGLQCKLLYDQFVSSLIELLSAVLLPFSGDQKVKKSSASKSNDVRKDGIVSSALSLQAHDVVSYIISIGILDKISVYFNNIRGSIDNDASGGEFLQNCLLLVTSLISISSPEEYLVLEPKKLEDSTQIILTLKMTHLVGIVSMMYGMLLHSDAPVRGNNPPQSFPKHTLDVTFLGFRMLNQVACLDLKMFQTSLGEEGTSLEFRHIASYLLWYCSHCSYNVLLHEVILCVGYFSLLNADNQLIIQSGQPPTILQQLCSLPFQYFSDPKLTCILFPTLICCCFRMASNKKILEQELSCALLSNFLEEYTLKDQQGQNQESSQDTSESHSLSSVIKFKQFCGSPVSHRISLTARFPKQLWHEAQTYFSSNE